MNNEVRETLCTNCSHRKVCSFKDEFLRAVKAVNDVTVDLPLKDDNTGSIIRLRDIRWIKPVELTCTYYSPQIKNPRLGSRFESDKLVGVSLLQNSDEEAQR